MKRNTLVFVCIFVPLVWLFPVILESCRQPAQEYFIRYWSRRHGR